MQRPALDPAVRAQLRANQQAYEDELRAAQYLDQLVRPLGKELVLPLGPVNQAHHGYLVRGRAIQSFDSALKDYIIFFQKEKHVLGGRSYVLVFENSNCSKASYSAFKTLLSVLPEKYFTGLHGIFVLPSSFVLKCLEWWNATRIHTFLSWITYHINSPQEALAYGVKINLGSQSAQRKTVAKAEQKLSSFSGLSLCEMDQSCTFGIPAPLMVLVMWFEQHPDKLRTKGIFRMAAAVDQIASLEHELVQKNYDALEMVQDPHLVCCLIKKILYKSKAPVFSEALYQSCVAALPEDAKQRLEFVRAKIQEEPVETLRLSLFLAEFLTRVVALEKENSMTAKNVAITFVPCFFRNPSVSVMAEVANNYKFISFLQTMVMDFEPIFGDQTVRQTYYSSTIETAKLNFSTIKDEQQEQEEVHFPDISLHPVAVEPPLELLPLTKTCDLLDMIEGAEPSTQVSTRYSGRFQAEVFTQGQLQLEEKHQIS